MSGKSPKLLHTLRDHKKRVTDVDWNHKKNAILSCAEDRNAYVWNFENGEWKPTLVVLRVNRAANCARWTSGGKKFAVGTSAKSVMICNYDEEHDFWVSKSIRKIKSAMTCLAWDPKGLIVAAGGTDSKVRIFNGVVGEVGDDDGNISQVATKGSFGAVLKEFPTMGPCNAMAFNGDGSKLVFCSQSSQVTLVSFNGSDDPNVFVMQTPFLPFTTCLFVGEAIYFAGHGKQLYMSKVDGEKFTTPEVVKAAAAAKAAKSNTANARNMFQKMANTGGKKAKGGATAHTFSVTSLTMHDKKLSTVANGDRTLIQWTI